MSFSASLREAAAPFWQETVANPFLDEMVAGTLDTRIFTHYLVQDYAFFHHFADLIAYGIVHAQKMTQMHQLSRFMSSVTDGENDYFLRAFQALGVAEAQYLQPRLNPVMQGFADTIRAATQRGYRDCLIVLSCAEWTYWTWGDRLRDQQPQAFYFREWIELHNNPEFAAFVRWLISELDALASESAEERQRLTALFRHCCQLERDFFYYAYEHGKEDA